MKKLLTMETDPQVLCAIQIATEAHKGQVDKAGADYIDHPIRVMAMGDTIEEKIVGVLHDVVEDTDWTFGRLEVEGFSSEVIEALRCITKLSEDEPYDDFISRVKTNPLAVKVKLNDLTDNMDIRRLPSLSDKDVERLKKYQRAYKQLLAESMRPVPTMDNSEALFWLAILQQANRGSDEARDMLLQENESRKATNRLTIQEELRALADRAK